MGAHAPTPTPAPAATTGLVFTSQPQIVPAAPSPAGQIVAPAPVQQQQQSLAASLSTQVVKPDAPAGSTAHVTMNIDKKKVSAVQAVCNC